MCISWPTSDSPLRKADRHKTVNKSYQLRHFKDRIPVDLEFSKSTTNSCKYLNSLPYPCLSVHLNGVKALIYLSKDSQMVKSDRLKSKYSPVISVY